MPGHKNCHKKDCHKKCDCKNKNREFGYVTARGFGTKSKTFYVSSSRGDDCNGDGSECNPWATMNWAFDATNNVVGATFYVDEGTYRVTTNVNHREFTIAVSYTHLTLPTTPYV